MVKTLLARDVDRLEATSPVAFLAPAIALHGAGGEWIWPDGCQLHTVAPVDRNIIRIEDAGA